MTKFEDLTSGQKDVLGQLFIQGPTWDGNIASKAYRDELCAMGLAEHRNGFAYLTRTGVDMAVTADVKNRHDKRWYRKQQGD